MTVQTDINGAPLNIRDCFIKSDMTSTMSYINLDFTAKANIRKRTVIDAAAFPSRGVLIHCLGDGSMIVDSGNTQRVQIPGEPYNGSHVWDGLDAIQTLRFDSVKSMTYLRVYALVEEE